MSKDVEWFGNQVLTKMRQVADFNEAEVANRVYREARRRCPIGKRKRYVSATEPSWKSSKPGRLKNSIKVYKSKYKDGGYIVIAGNYDAFYARFVELGTPGLIMKREGKAYLRTPIPAKRFLRGPLEGERKVFRKKLKEAFE